MSTCSSVRRSEILLSPATAMPGQAEVPALPFTEWPDVGQRRRFEEQRERAALSPGIGTVDLRLRSGVPDSGDLVSLHEPSFGTSPRPVS